MRILAGAPGFEPGITGPKPVALPLGHAPTDPEQSGSEPARCGAHINRGRADPATAAIQQDELLRLQNAIADLPEHLRHVLVLREYGELEYEAIATAMRITAATARQYRHRAVLMLAGKLVSKGR